MQITRERHWPHFHSHAGLLIPDFVANHNADAKTLTVAVAIFHTRLAGRIETVPRPDELLNLHGNLKVVGKDLLKRRCGARLRAEQANVMEQSLVGNGLALLQARRAHPDEVQQAMGEAIFIPKKVGDRKTIFLPCPMEE